jgi:starvation-inducible DNA-binding protein
MNSIQFNSPSKSMEIVSNTNYIPSTLANLLSLEYVFFAKIQNFHWNLTGMSFVGLHKLLNKHYQKIGDFVDQIAEQIRKYGYASPGSLQEFLTINNQINGIDESIGALINERSAIEILLLNHDKLIQYINSLETSKIDLATQNLLGNILDFHMKAAWMLRSHL